MSDSIRKNPTVVNARELYLNSNIDFTYNSPPLYPPGFALYLPDGKYYLEFLAEEYTLSGKTINYYDKYQPRFYLFDSDDKWTGIILTLEISNNPPDQSGSSKNPIIFNLPSDLNNKKYKLNSEKGKFTIKTPKNETIKVRSSQFLREFYSRKLQKLVRFDYYPSYIPSQEEIAKSKGIVVSGDNNQPIKGATIEKTD